MAVLRTSDEWRKFHQVEILDPDGWRTPDAPDFYDDAISEDEFWERYNQSTVRIGRWEAGPVIDE